MGAEIQVGQRAAEQTRQAWGDRMRVQQPGVALARANAVQRGFQRRMIRLPIELAPLPYFLRARRGAFIQGKAGKCFGGTQTGFGLAGI
jgi:hypothetical protein